MREIDVLIESNPALAKEMVLIDQRNRQAHNELHAFNTTGKFINKHPFLVKKNLYNDIYSELSELKRSNPESFINEITNVIQNIRRIQSNINNKKYKSTDEKTAWEQNLEKVIVRKQVIADIISK